jgi:hypothetical protein
MDYNRQNYPFNEYSETCYYGNGVGCDEVCLCPCHGAHAPNFLTNEQVMEWHGFNPDGTEIDYIKQHNEEVAKTAKRVKVINRGTA